jgi:predicted nucleic acid-binding protein
MIVLDTNVLSEALRPAPSAAVLRWLAAQPRTVLFTTTVSEAEMLYGLELMPNSRRRRSYEESIALIFAEEFAGRILPFDSGAAREFALVAAVRRRRRIPIATLDAQIAGIARSRGAALATRDVADFADCGIEVIDPWRS